MPPGLVKKRQRWSLGLLRRRSSSYGSQGSEQSGGSSESYGDQRRPMSGHSDAIHEVSTRGTTERTAVDRDTTHDGGGGKGSSAADSASGT